MRYSIKISLRILFGLICVLVTAISVVLIFSYFTQSFRQEQNDYFSKVDYTIEGNVVDWQKVGGNYYLIEFEPTRFEIPKNKIHSSDDYVGVFASDTSNVFIIAPISESFSSTLEKVGFSTHNRKFVFNDSSSTVLRTASLYKRRLPHGENYIPF